MPRPRGAVYQIERVPPDLWRRAKARAALEGQSIRDVFLGFLQTYTAGFETPNHHHHDLARSIASSSSSATRNPPPVSPSTEGVQSASAPRPARGISSPDPDLGF